MTELVADLQARLQSRAKADKRRWWEQYLKGQAAFRGVPMGDVRECVARWTDDYHLLTAFSDADLFRLASRLIAQQHSEDKLAATLFIQEHLLPAGHLHWETHLEGIARFFDQGYLADWNVVDWFSVKALWAFVERDGAHCGLAVLAWSDAANLWRARASVVTFANVAGRGETVFEGFTDGVLTACSDLIRRPERFAKTGVGWVLRGLHQAAPEQVLRFVDRHLHDFSVEALRSAARNFSPSVTRELLGRVG